MNGCDVTGGGLEDLIFLEGEEPAGEGTSSLAPLSHGQRSLWFVHHLVPGGSAYNIAAASRVLTPIDAGVLERALQALVDRHDALRTTVPVIPGIAGEPRQRVAGRLDFALSCEDATGWSEERMRSRLAEESWRPFDLEQGPLLRVTLWTGVAGGPLMLLVIHHIVADFWSLAIVARELSALCREAAGAGPALLPPPGHPYAELVRLEREMLDGERGAALLAYWKERLAGLPILELATDRPRPAVQTYHGDSFRLRLPASLVTALRARSRAQRGTLFMALVAAFQAFLCRHTGQEDLAVGSPRAGRSQSKFAGTVGYFVNPVVLRGDLAGDPGFTEILERTRAMVLSAFEHGDYPLPLLAEHLQPERDASRTPLFQVAFVLQKETRGAEGLTAFALGEEGVEVDLGYLRLESIAPCRPPAPFDLLLHAVERQDGLSFALQYNSDLFDASTAERLMERFTLLLESVVRTPDLALSALPLLPDAERHQLLCAWNDTAGPEQEENLFELFEAQVGRTPDAEAVVFEEERVTYAELADRARALASHLADLGVGPEVVVGVAVERSVEMVTGLLGVLGAGGAYLPLEPSLPRQRLAMILEDAHPAVLLTLRSQAAALPLDAAPGARLAWLDDVPPAAPAGRPLRRAEPDNAAYVIYTSGSTGRPKGVVNSHRGIVNRLLWMQEYLGLDESDRVLQKTPFGFDVSVWEFFLPLIVGARLVVARPEGHRDSAYLVRLVQREGITTLHFVPSMLPFFLAEEGVADCRSLRNVIVSGEALPWEVEQRCLEVLAAPLHNLYGPTEAAVDVTAWVCQPAARPRSVPIGRPVRNTQIHVIGRRFELMPSGAVGELAIGGVQVARGYLGRPDLTAERFVPDPHGGTPGARLYRTGDLSRFLPGGEIEYLGRLDHQVKIRGFRIELREIEIALATHPAVREVAVVLRQEPGAERSLLACVVPREEEEPGAVIASALRDYLADRLPPYMVPAFAFGHELDRLPNGKLDRRALARWTPAAGAARSVVAPRTPLEELLAGLVSEVLGGTRIGVEDSFFEYGGHSIAAMRLIARVREALGVDLPLHRVFETPTVAALARVLEAASRRGAVPAPPLVPVPRDAPLPLSFAQQRLWFLHQLEPASPVYNVPAAIHVRGRLDHAALAAALAGVVHRHESLRTRFIAEPGGPVQVVEPPAPVPLPAIDLAGLPAARRMEEALRLARAEALRPFDLAGGPLLRATLVSLDAEERLLLLTLHHIVSDGWSLRVLAHELGEIYGACLERRPPSLPVLEIQYGDYAVWQRRWLQGELLDAELAHWRRRLAGAPAVLDLPLDRPRPAVLSHRGASRALALPPELLHSLQVLARRQGVTLFMSLLAAFQALLTRASGVEDVSVGTPVAGRGQIRTEGLIGFFVNTLVMRTDLSGEPSFTRLVERVREVALDAYGHQDLPFEKLVEELQPRRDLSYSPLFQVSFTLDGDPPPSLRLGDAEVTLWPAGQETEKFDLSLTLGLEGEGLSGTLGFRADLFDGATIERLAGHFARLLAGAVAAPRLRLSELPLLSDAERRQLLDWNAAEPAESRETTVTALWQAQVERAPEAPAVSFAGETLSYGELDRRAGRLARRLRRLGVGPEERVGMLLERSLELVVGLLGILKAGGAYVPLDPAAPEERLAFLCRDSGIRVLITDGREDLPSVETVVRLGVEREEVKEDGWELEAAVGPDNLCYVIYTSGSTGQPKGVLVRHGSVARLLSATERWFSFGPSDVWTLFHSSAFDFSVWELWGALAYGGRLVVVPYWVSRSPEAFWRLLVDERVTVLNQTPSAFRQLIQADGEAPAAERERLALRLVIFGGEALDLASLRPWYERHNVGTPRLVNMYGITETTVHVSYRPLDLADLEECHRSPIGEAIPDLDLRLLGPGLEFVPVGVPGEICVGGPGLARGYLGRPELTAERFVPDPFSEQPGERLYRSGDLARYRSDGQIDYLGRRDQQVKVRGFRIEPGEIEAALLAHAEVRSAIVLPRRDASGGVVLAACLETAPGAVSAGELRTFLKTRLPEYMVPAAFVFVESMPLTGNGKLDRRALETLPLEMEKGEATDAEAPRTPVEELVAGIFAEVLKLERVGAAADFFELGGHSLLATQVASRIRAVFGVELPVRTVFEAPTVAALASWIEQAGAGEGPPPIRQVPRQGRLELSFAQQRLWFLDQLQPGSAMYNIPMAVRVRGPFDVAALAASLAASVRRHEALRTTFTAKEGGPVQVIAGEMEVPLPIIDLAGLHAGQMRQWVEAEARRPFDLEKGPLLRASLLRTAEREHLLLLCVHHIIADGWSIGVLINEIAASYDAHLEGRPAPLPPLPVQYADFAAWQREWMSGEVLEQRLSYWRRRLTGAPGVLELPTDRPRPALRGERGGYLPVQLPEGLAADLRALSRREGATLFMTLLAGFQALLARYSGQEDVLVGSPVAGRDLGETEPLVGLFVNTLVLRLDLSGEPALDELLGRVRETTLDAYSRADLPFELLVAELQPERDLRHTPLFQVMFVMQNTAPVALRLGDLVLDEHPVHAGTAKFDLMLTLSDAGRGLTGFLEYSSDLFDETTVARLAGHLENLLTGLAAGSARSWAALPLLGDAERTQLLEEWNDTAQPLPEATLHEVVARQAERHPDLPAVVSEGAVLTYRDLDRQAGRLAARLRALGVGPEVPVALYFARSADAMVAILGVLKAGGAYLPLETHHPAERLAGILADAGHPLLVTERRLEGTLTGMAASAAKILWMDEVQEAGEGVPAAEPLPEGLAYVLHTSGSTGKPKGVCCTHRGVFNLLADFARRQPLAPGSRGSLWTSLSFDVSVYEIFSPLLAGGAVHIVPEAVRQDTVRFVDWLIEERIDSAYVPPFMVAALRERLERTPGAASLRRLLVGVEPIPEPLLTRIAELCPRLSVINGYGPTEATICATLYGVEPGRDRFGNPPVTPIGHAVQNTGLYLLDRYHEPVPVGIPGELYIAGAGLARGYLNKPEATAERFVPHPWSTAGGERLYRTGDLVRRRPDGNIDFLGRIDHQIKLRGFRIEPGEIEAALLSHPEVREAVVTVLAPAGQAALEGREHRRLVAYVVGAEGHTPSSRELRDFLRERLPAYMVPAAFVALPALPLTTSGKLDRKALPEPVPEGAADESMATRTPPRTPVEELVAGVFAQVLGLERVGREDDFFALGGHSLLATQVASRVRSVLGVEMPVRAVFEAPTIEGLAARIAAAPAEGLPPLVPVDRTGPLPLSYSQERLWFLQQLEPGSAIYNIQVGVELSGSLRADLLSRALAEVVRRQESLRTAFPVIDGAPRQRVSPPPAGVTLPLVDLSALPAAAERAAAESLERELAGRGFDLERGPLFAALLVRLTGERHHFLLNLHHTIADGWSAGVLVREMGTLYAAAREGRPSLLPELPIQYADFALWQREALAGRQAEQLAYWEDRLGGEIAPLQLPTDRPRPAVQTFRGGRRRLVLAPDLAARLARFGRGEGVTLFMTLLAATQALLSRHGGEQDVPVGAPVAGRQRVETEGLIGCFLNTLVLRTDLSSLPSFRELAARVRTVTLEAYANQDVPFEAVLARLRLDRDLSRTPLFQVLFNMLNLPRPELSLPGLSLRLLTPAEVPSKLDLTFYAAEADAGVQIDLVYNADLFDEARIAELLAQLELLLAQTVERPEEPVDRLPLLTASALAVLPDPGEALAEPDFPPVSRMFLDRERELPEQTALCWSEGSWTYSELGARAREIACAVLEAGAGPGDVIAVSGPRSPGLIAGLLGAFLSGGALLILDRNLPEARLRVIVEEARPACLVYIGEAQPQDEWLWELAPCRIIQVAPAAPPEIRTRGLEPALPLPAPDDLAYIFFTSGTTGRPKAVLGRQKGLSHFLTWQRETFGIGPGDRAAQLTGLSFDVVLRDIFLPLTSGATLVLPDEDDRSPERILRWLRERSITVVHTVPSLASAWLGASRDTGSDVLRWTFFAGELLLDWIVERWRTRFPLTGVVNLYGPTETTLAKCFYCVPEPSVEQVQPVGMPLPQTQALILAEGRRCGIGEVGEIVLRTPFRSLGYLNPEDGRLRFRPNPFGNDPDDLLYFTGDRGRYRLDGTLDILGRIDEQVKVRGVRIELAEVRAALGRHPAVWESVVLAREVLPGDHRLVAYLVLRPGAALDPEDLRRHLRRELPEAMVPSAFVPLDALPLTPNGKVDRRALERIAPELSSSAGEGSGPRTPVEEIVAGLWSEILGLPRIGRDDNFFQLGGHSLSGGQVVSRLRQAFQADLPLRILFEAPTVATLATEIERQRRQNGSPERPAIVSGDHGSPAPLSFAQERFWVGRELEARTVASTLPSMVRLEGRLDLACLRRALQEVVDRHEVLRTVFREDGNGPVQVVLPVFPVHLPVVDLGPLSPQDRMAELRRLSILDGRSPFDFERGPLFRLTLFRNSERDHVLLSVVHHIAFDGWSRAVLIGELSALYNAFREGRPSPLTPLPVQYQDFARWQRQILAGESLAREMAYWREHLRSAQPLDLRGDRQPPARPTFQAAVEPVTVPEELERELEAFAAAHCVTLFMTLFSAFTALLHQETGQDDIVTICMFANRNRVETENLIGNFYAGLPLRTRLTGACTFRDLLERVREVTLAAHEHPDLPDEAGLPTCGTLFQLAKLPSSQRTWSGLEVTHLPVDTGVMRKDLSLFLAQSGRLEGRFRYNRDVLDPERVFRMRERFINILAAVVADPDCPLVELGTRETVGDAR